MALTEAQKELRAAKKLNGNGAGKKLNGNGHAPKKTARKRRRADA